jgi:hypothetical protein
MTTMKKYNNWLTNFGKCWGEKDFSLLRDLLSENIEYYESPNQNPLTNKKDIVNQWERDLEKQEKISFSYDILQEDKGLCIVNWKASFLINTEEYKYDGIYIIRLNENNQCTYFKQWCVEL